MPGRSLRRERTVTLAEEVFQQLRKMEALLLQSVWLQSQWCKSGDVAATCETVSSFWKSRGYKAQVSSEGKLQVKPYVSLELDPLLEQTVVLADFSRMHEETVQVPVQEVPLKQKVEVPDVEAPVKRVRFENTNASGEAESEFTGVVVPSDRGKDATSASGKEQRWQLGIVAAPHGAAFEVEACTSIDSAGTGAICACEKGATRLEVDVSNSESPPEKSEPEDAMRPTSKNQQKKAMVQARKLASPVERRRQDEERKMEPMMKKKKIAGQLARDLPYAKSIALWGMPSEDFLGCVQPLVADSCKTLESLETRHTKQVTCMTEMYEYSKKNKLEPVGPQSSEFGNIDAHFARSNQSPH